MCLMVKNICVVFSHGLQRFARIKKLCKTLRKDFAMLCVKKNYRFNQKILPVKIVANPTQAKYGINKYEALLSICLKT